MGLRGLSVREELVPQLPVLLARTGATVALDPVSAEDIERGYPAVLRCSASDGGCVALLVHRAKATGPYDMVVILAPKPPSLWNGKTDTPPDRTDHEHSARERRDGPHTQNTCFKAVN